MVPKFRKPVTPQPQSSTTNVRNKHHYKNVSLFVHFVLLLWYTHRISELKKEHRKLPPIRSDYNVFFSNSKSPHRIL